MKRSQPNERRRLERMVIALHQKVDSLLRGQDITFEMEFSKMADFSQLVAEVEATRGDVASTKVFVEGLEKQLADLAAGMNDEEDQAKVQALATDLASIRATLPKAIAANPV